MVQRSPGASATHAESFGSTIDRDRRGLIAHMELADVFADPK
jgi:hypothetical protein